MMHRERSGVELSHVRWRKSTFSGDQGNCVEVADGIAGVVPVRDSKNPQDPALRFAPEAWSAFVDGVKAARFPGV